MNYPVPDGSVVFDRYGAPCHQITQQDTVFTRLRGLDANTAEETLVRDLLRDAYLGNLHRPEGMPVRTQWEVLPLFLAIFVAGLVLWLVMMKRYEFLREGAAGETVIEAERRR